VSEILQKGKKRLLMEILDSPDGSGFGFGAFPYAEGAKREPVLNIEEPGPPLLCRETVQVAPLRTLLPAQLHTTITQLVRIFMQMVRAQRWNS
jgi:hypothetical protein